MTRPQFPEIENGVSSVRLKLSVAMTVPPCGLAVGAVINASRTPANRSVAVRRNVPVGPSRREATRLAREMLEFIPDPVAAPADHRLGRRYRRLRRSQRRSLPCDADKRQNTSR